MTAPPIDITPLANVAHDKAAGIDRAAKATRNACKEWRAPDGAERKKILHRVADGIEARADEIALVECIDTVQALKLVSKVALRGAAKFRSFADRAP